MMVYSNSSREKLKNADPYLQKIFKEAIKISPVDFGIAQTSRTVEQQRQYFNEGKSKINPDKYSKEELPRKAKHIVTDEYPLSRAVDIYAYIQGKGASWDEKHLCFIAGIILSLDKKYENRLRWGGNWDQDGEIISDQKFQDLPHFELIK